MCTLKLQICTVFFSPLEWCDFVWMPQYFGVDLVQQIILGLVQLLCFWVISSRKWSDTVCTSSAPSALKFLANPCHPFDIVMRTGMRSLIVSVRLNDSTYLASSVSAHLLTLESPQTCAHTHSHNIHIIIPTCLLLVLIIAILVLDTWLYDTLHCMFAMSLRLHGHASVHSALKPVFMNKGCPRFQSTRYVQALPFQTKNVSRADVMMMV